ncbi:uncharacterized protein TNCV_4398801 [Trichonephila clavipes]|nr:uncharacterized protein TNCV_4398801 [Trichonephila clavipes]
MIEYWVANVESLRSTELLPSTATDFKAGGQLINPRWFPLKKRDDAKAKLLSQLLTKFQRVINAPKPPLRVTIEEPEQQETTVIARKETSLKEDPTLREIILSVPANFQKFIPPIAEKLKNA